MDDFIKAINGEPEGPEIWAYFRGQSEPAIYTTAVLELLKTDPDILDIVSAETGEIIFTRND